MKSNMNHSFSKVPSVEIQRSSFQRNFSNKTTFDADFLVPILVDDVIPGDTFNVNCHFVTRLTSPTVVPLMDNMFMETFFFFVPYRLLWSNWEKFCGAQDDPGDSIDFTIPVMSGAGGNNVGDVADYMGLPSNYSMDDLGGVSALPGRAYKMIWNEWFRDQNLQDQVDVPLGDGPDVSANVGDMAHPPLKRGKRHDYFTSALPWPQKGDAVTLPLGNEANVFMDNVTNGGAGDITAFAQSDSLAKSLDSSGTDLGIGSNDASGIRLYADLGSATGVPINDLRLAFQTQKLLERDARGGTRYVETLKAHWGVTSPDFRLQRPEFLGGGSSKVEMSGVAQTTFEGTQTIENAKGAMSGMGQANGTHSFSKSFVEHGVIIGLANVRADITYSQGIDRYWHKSTRYDFFYPVLAQIGEQSVLNKELFFSDSVGLDDQVFGYQERYAEYRYKNSQMSGLMRVDAAGSLEVFHLSEDFASLPALGDTFIQANLGAPLDRAISVPTQPQFIADFFFEMKCARPMPMFGVPGNMDRF